MIKKTVVGLALAGLLIATPMAIPTLAQETVTLEQKIEKKFPNQQIKDIKNFQQYADDILEIIAKRMNVKLDKNIPKPKILTEDQITQEEYNKWAGFPYKTKCNVYFDKPNIIVLTLDTQLDSLAHEDVHYIQIKYQGIDPKNDPLDFLEDEAVFTQHWFEDKYLK